MLKDRLLCWLNRHQPVRNRVRTSDPVFRGLCRHCGDTIYRESPRRWRTDRVAASDSFPPAPR